MNRARKFDLHSPTFQYRAKIPAGIENSHDPLRCFSAFRATVHAMTPTSLLVSFSGKRADAIWLLKSDVRISNGWLVLTDQFIVERGLVWVYDA